MHASKNSISRRAFLAATGASAAWLALGCGETPSGAMDVVVIGAGWAGVGAGRALKTAGLQYTILEAQGRIGGRCFCDNSFPAPFDYGAQFFHQCVLDLNNPTQTTNPLLNMALDMGVETVPDLFDRLQLDAEGRPLSLEQTIDMAVDFLQFDATVEAHGRAASLGARDKSVLEATSSLRNRTYYDFCRLVQCGERGTSADKISSLALYEFSKLTTVPIGTPSTDNWFIKTGMGNFLLRLAAGLPIQLSTPVTSIDTTGSTVKVNTPSGTIEARAVIVTASVGVLASGRPSFTPALPVAYTTAFTDLEMGTVAKVAFEFSENVFTGMTENTFITGLPRPGEEMIPTVFAKIFGHRQCAMLFGGAPCRDLELSGGDAALLDYGREVVTRYLGADAAAKITRSATHSWLNDEWALGAYQMALPGRFTSAHKQLQTPIDNRISTSPAKPCRKSPRARYTALS